MHTAGHCDTDDAHGSEHGTPASDAHRREGSSVLGACSVTDLASMQCAPYSAQVGVRRATPDRDHRPNEPCPALQHQRKRGTGTTTHKGCTEPDSTYVLTDRLTSTGDHKHRNLHHCYIYMGYTTQIQ